MSDEKAVTTPEGSSGQRPIPTAKAKVSLHANPLDAALPTAIERWLVRSVGPENTRSFCFVLSAVTLGLWHRGLLGDPSFTNVVVAVQNVAVLLLLSFTPMLAFHPVPRRAWAALAAALFVGAAAGPVAVRLLAHLFFGHVREDANWYDAVWRIYAIMALWLSVAVFAETKIRPVLKARAAIVAARPASKTGGGGGGGGGMSLVSRVHAHKLELRDRRLKEIDGRMKKAVEEQELSRRAVASFDRTVATAHKNLEETARMVSKAEERLELARRSHENAIESNTIPEEVAAAASAVKDAEVELERAKVLHQGATDHEDGLGIQIQAHRLILGHANDRIATLSREREEAMSLDSYGFFR